MWQISCYDYVSNSTHSFPASVVFRQEAQILTNQHELLDAAIKKVGNRYLATMLVAKRIRQLHHGAPAYVKRNEGESHFTVAMREIAAGLVFVETPVSIPGFANGVSTDRPENVVSETAEAAPEATETVAESS
jgi:DNA-directed RNA polymerase omega subunit